KSDENTLENITPNRTLQSDNIAVNEQCARVSRPPPVISNYRLTQRCNGIPFHNYVALDGAVRPVPWFLFDTFLPGRNRLSPGEVQSFRGGVRGQSRR